MKATGLFFVLAGLLIVQSAQGSVIQLTWQGAPHAQAYAYAKSHAAIDQDQPVEDIQNHHADVNAHAMAQHNPSQWQETFMDSLIEGLETPGLARLHSLMSFETTGAGAQREGNGNGHTDFGGYLLIDSENLFPTGTDLTLEIAATPAAGQGWTNRSWSMRVYDMQGGTLLGTLGDGSLGASLSVTSGSSVYVVFEHQVSKANVPNGQATDEVSVAFSTIPEPASLLLLSLGAAGLVRRRR